MANTATIEDAILVVRKVFKPFLDKFPDGDKDSLRLVDDLGMDSLDVMEVILTCENLLYINIDDAEASRCRTFGDVKNIVYKQVELSKNLD